METPKSEINTDQKSADTAVLEKPAAQPSAGKEDSTSEQPRYTYSQLRKAISDALATQGGTLGKERDTFRGQAEKTANDLKAAADKVTELQADRDQLKADIESLAEDDPEKAGKLSQRLKTMDEAVRSAKAKEDAADKRVRELEEQMSPYAETVNFALGVTLEASVFEVAEEYTDGNDRILKELCEAMGIKGDKDTVKLKESIRKVADILQWQKKDAKPKDDEAPLVVDSGVANGGGEDLSKLSGRELLLLGLRRNKRR